MDLQTATLNFSKVKNFDGFSDFLRESENTTLSPKRFGIALNIDTQTLARQAHVHRNTITYTPQF